MENYQSNLPLIHLKDANERQKKLLEDAKKAFGFIPNVMQEMANYPPLLESYLTGVDSFRNESGFTPVEQEVVFITISFENNCTYCVASHSLLADVSAKMLKQIIEALRKGEELPDEKLNALKEFTAHVLLERGFPTAEAAQEFMKAGYSEEQVLAIIHAISLKTLSNYVNHIFDTELDTITKAWEWKPTQKVRSFLKK